MTEFYQSRIGRWLGAVAGAVVSLAATTQALTPVTEADAKRVAGNWVTTTVSRFGDWNGSSEPRLGVPQAVADSEGNLLAFYVPVEPQGYVLVGGWQEMAPLQAYATEGRLDFSSDSEQAGALLLRTGMGAAVAKAMAEEDGERGAGSSPQAAAWQAFLAAPERDLDSPYNGIAGLVFSLRESLLEKRQYAGGYTGKIRWHGSYPLNSKVPVMNSIPEEIWSDLGPEGGAPSGTWTNATDLLIYDGEFPGGSILDGTPGANISNGPGGLWFYDTHARDGDDNITVGADGIYTPFGEEDEEKEIFLDGESIWREEPGGTVGVYDQGIDTRIFPPPGYGAWLAPNGAVGTQGAQGLNNLLYWDKDENGRYSYIFEPAIAGTYAVAFAELTRYWEWPRVGTGSHTYQWAYNVDEANPDKVTDITVDFEHPISWENMPLNMLPYTAGTEQVDNVAQHIFEVAACFETEFDDTGVFLSLDQSSLDRFAHHYNYNGRAIQFLTRPQFETADEWLEVLRREIDAGRPVVLQVFNQQAQFTTALVDGYDIATGVANSYLLHCIISGFDYWFTLDNLLGTPIGAGGTGYGAVKNQTMATGVMPIRTPQNAVCEFFRSSGDADAASLSQTMSTLVGMYGRRMVVLAYHPDQTDPYYPAGRTAVTTEMQRRMAAYGISGASPATVICNGRETTGVQASGDAVTDLIGVRAEIERRIAEPSRYFIRGDCILGRTPGENRPVLNADVYVSRTDEDVEPSQEDLTLRLFLAEDVDASNLWVVRELLATRSLSFAYGQTRVVNQHDFSLAPDDSWDLDNCFVAAVLESAGHVIQAVRLDHFAPGPNYTYLDDLDKYRPTLVNRAPVAPYEVVLTQERDDETGTWHLRADPVAAYDPDGDALTYLYAWYREGVLQGGLTTSTVPVDIADLATLWHCQVRVRDAYYAEGDQFGKADSHVSTAVPSNPVIVTLGAAPAGNNPPSAPTAAVFTPQFPAEGDDVVCLAGGAGDPDGDTLTYVYRWYKDGVVQTAHTGAALPFGVIQSGEQWRCEVAARDVWGATSAFTTTVEITVSDPLPGAPSPPILLVAGPSEPSYVSTLVCSAPVGVVCDDDVTFHYRWWVRTSDGGWRPTEHTDSEVQMGVEHIGTLWRCAVYGRNAETGANGPVTYTNALLVRNFVPSRPTVTVAPQYATVDQNVVCFAGSSIDKETSPEQLRYFYEWYVDGEPSGFLGYDVTSVPSTATTAGQDWTCHVFVEDEHGGRSDTVISISAAHIGGPPTTPTGAFLSHVRPQPEDSITVEAIGATDPDGDPVSYIYHWYREEPNPPGVTIEKPYDFMPGNTGGFYWKKDYSAPEMPAAVTEYLQRWTVVVFASDGEFLSDPIGTNAIWIGNRAPSLPEVRIEPANPYASEPLECTIGRQSTDPDADVVSYRFRWYVQGETEPRYLGQVLPAGTTLRNEVWYCEVEAYDDWKFPKSVKVKTDPVSFEPQPPTPPSEVRIDPPYPKAGMPLECLASGSADPNGGGVIYHYMWQRFNPASSQYETPQPPQDDPFAYRRQDLSHALVANDDRWRCLVYTSDNDEDTSDTIQSAPVSVGNRTPEAPARVTITPNPAGMAEDLICQAGGSLDPNGDPITYVYQWYQYVEGEDLGQPIEGYRLDKRHLQLGDTWFCGVKATDGEAISATTNSEHVTIVDLPPTVPATVVLEPEAPTTRSNVVCNASGASDPERGAVSYTYHWYRFGVATNETGRVLPYDRIALNEEWTCKVRSVDPKGQVSDQVESEPVTIISPNPSDPTANVVPASPTRTDTLTCQASGSVDPSDPDAGENAIQYRYEWSFRAPGQQQWTVPEPVILTATVDSSRLQNGYRWRCKVTAVSKATSEESSTVTSNEVEIVNDTPTAPTEAVVSLQPAQGTIACLADGATDYDTFRYAYNWQKHDGAGWVDVAPDPDIQNPGDLSVLTVEYDGSYYRCEVWAVDKDNMDGGSLISDVVHVVQGIDGAPEITIQAIGRTLRATAVLRDLGDVEVILLFAWYRNGFKTEYTGVGVPGLPGEWSHIISPPPFGTQEVWECRAYAVRTDNRVAGQTGSATIELDSIPNSSPTAPVIRLTPPEPTFNNDLVVLIDVDSTDADGDDVVYFYQWYRDALDVTGYDAATLPAEATENGQSWYCEVFARDVFGATSEIVQSNSVRIGSPAGRDPYEDDDEWRQASMLTAETNQTHNVGAAVDPDWMKFEIVRAATVTIETTVVAGQATLESALFTEDNVATGVPMSTSPGDEIQVDLGAGTYYLRVTGSKQDEGVVFPIYLVDLTVDYPAVGNHAPTAPTTAYLIPSAPIPGDNIKCVSYGASDQDEADTLSYIYRWYQNGNLRPDLSGSDRSVLSGAAVRLGDTWRCRVHVDDGNGSTSADFLSGEVEVGPGAAWTAEIALTGSTSTNTLAIGQGENATDDWDEGIDDNIPPWPPELTTPLFWLVNKGQDGPAYVGKDIRSLDNRIVLWEMRIDTSYTGEVITLSWVPGELSSRGIMQIADTNTGQVQDMRTETSLKIEPDGEIHVISIFYSASFSKETLSLTSGWNLVSFYLQGLGDTPRAVFGGAKQGDVWTWGVGGSGAVYTSVSTLEPARPYWVFVSEAVTVEHVGYPVFVSDYQLIGGWNLIGTTDFSALPTSPDLQHSGIFYWHNGTYRNPLIFERHRGFWIRSNAESIDMTIRRP